MPYVFAMLVLVNAILLGYFVVFNDNGSSSSQERLLEARSQLDKEISFKNSSENVNPMIGVEK